MSKEHLINLLKKHFPILFGILGTIWLIIEVSISGSSSSDKSMIPWITIGATVLCFLIYLFYLWRNKKRDFTTIITETPDKRTEMILEKSMNENTNSEQAIENINFGLEVRHVKSKAELAPVARLDNKAYGGDSVSLAGLEGWWKRYPEGVFIMLEKNQIVGAFGIYPVSKITFDGIIAGLYTEDEIDPRRILKANPKYKDLFYYWYLADIILDKDADFSFGEPLLTLLVKSVKLWLESGYINTNKEAKINICAIGATEEGKRLLKKCGFTEIRTVKTINESTGLNSVFEMRSTYEKLNELHQYYNSILQNYIYEKRRNRQKKNIIRTLSSKLNLTKR